MLSCFGLFFSVSAVLPWPGCVWSKTYWDPKLPDIYFWSIILFLTALFQAVAHIIGLRKPFNTALLNWNYFLHSFNIQLVIYFQWWVHMFKKGVHSCVRSWAWLCAQGLQWSRTVCDGPVSLWQSLDWGLLQHFEM